MSEKRSQDLLDELGNFIPKKTKYDVVHARSMTALATSINLMSFIKSNYTDEQYEDLLKKFFLAVKTGNTNKFIHKLREIEKDVTR
jgi:hypothetical protein